MRNTAQGARARARTEITTAIKDEARRQLAAEGAAKLSLRAVARELGMVSSALYRYFPSRDDLLTALIIDAYDAIGEAAEKAHGAAAGAEPAERWVAVCEAVRAWALAHPHEYALIYGSPVPGYAAPQDTVPAAARVGRVFIGLAREAYRGREGEGEGVREAEGAGEADGGRARKRSGAGTVGPGRGHSAVPASPRSPANCCRRPSAWPRTSPPDCRPRS